MAKRYLAAGKMQAFLLLITLVLCIAALLKLAPLLRNYDTVHVQFLPIQTTDSAGARFDKALLDQLQFLSHTRSFDHTFTSGGRQVTFDKPLWIDRCEVRQSDFSKFSSWQVFYPDVAIASPHQPENWRYFSESKGHTISGRLEAAANSVTWFDAYAYCRAASGRLPYTDEWIAAAVGRDLRLYPWGDTFNASAWPYLDPLLNAAQKCGVHPKTDTPEGVADLGSNVSEWATSRSNSAASFIMGGNAYNTPKELYSLSALYRQTPPKLRSHYLGFRCVYDNKPTAITAWRIPPSVVRVPAGSYQVGMPEGARVPQLVAALPKDRLDLVHRIFTRAGARKGNNSLYVTATEITRDQYADFLSDPFVKIGLYAEENQPATHSYVPTNWETQKQQPDLPVVSVDWWSAYAFAAWAGGRLPSAEEWASIASNQGRRLYPWGNIFEQSFAITAEQSLTGPIAVPASKKDSTETGVFDLGGNVSEWTSSVSSNTGAYAIVIKGGNYLLPGLITARMDFNNHVSPHHRSPTLGFRVVFTHSR